MLLYPTRASIDAWGELGNPGWSFNSLKPYFDKSTTFHPPGQAAKEITGLGQYHEDGNGGHGPLQASFGDSHTAALDGAWMETFSSLGLKMTADPRTGRGLGAFQTLDSINPSTKTRSWSASAYFGPEVRARPNVTLLSDTTVKRIVTDGTEEDVVARGVVVQTEDGEKTIFARHEVILAAGALQSPQILELSGIGGRALLESHGISVVIDNPNVGEHLQDHAMVCQSFEANDGIASGDVARDPDVVNAYAKRYRNSRDGPLGNGAIHSVAYAPLADNSGPISTQAREDILNSYFSNSVSSRATPIEKQLTRIRSILEDPQEPVVEYMLYPAQLSMPDEPKSFVEMLNPVLPENYISVLTILNHPFSRGSVHIASPSVSDKPIWDPKYLSHPLDLELLARNVQFVEKIIGTGPFQSAVRPGGKRIPDIVGDTLEKAKEIVRQRQLSVFHLAGSCAMLPREDGGVVNERLVVHGTRNIRVVDASVFPLEPVGNIQATVYAVAEKAADLIKEDRPR